MRVEKKIFLLLISILFICMPFLSKRVYAETSSENDSSKYTIESYDVHIKVNENNVYDITSTLKVNFYGKNNHGIYFRIPVWNKYTNYKKKTDSRRARIKNIDVLSDHKFESYLENGYMVIKLGDENTIVSNTTQEYKVKYSYLMGHDPYEGFDDLIIYPYGYYWENTIYNPTFEIEMPNDSFSEDDLNIWIDKLHTKKADNDTVYTYVIGNTIYGTVMGKIEPGAGITVDLKLEDGYFKNTKSTYGHFTKICCTISILIGIASFVMWLIFGKDKKKYVSSVEYYPPENLNSADLGYIYATDGRANYRKMFTSLIIYLAGKGYINISEEKEGKSKEIYLYRTEKEYTDGNSQEKELLDTMFSGNPRINLKKDCKGISATYFKLGSEIKQKYKYTIFHKNSQKAQIVNIVLTIISIIAWIMGFAIEDMEIMNFGYLYYIYGLIGILLSMFFIFIMIKRTQEGEKILGKILGFKMFIKTAEKNQIEALVEEDPKYFYKILPYAYVLNVTNKWIKKFEELGLQDSGDIGGYNFCSIDSFNYFTAAAFSAYASGSGTSSGGCSSCGGGCSSCGGGGGW